ncbi:MAG: ABC transporter permease [Planctomycetes bacterium]|nr:ABC transporter permease [Planctomycetota bacterium]
MYKLLLCWRYLRTRYIALVCIVSVMLGVATMIVVNSVMAGFTNEMQARMNGMLGDLILESRSMDGVLDSVAHMAKIREVAGDAILGMSPTVHVPALMYIELNGQLITHQAMLVGIDELTYTQVSEFGTYLQHSENREQLSFQLRNGGYDVYDHQVPDRDLLQPRKQMEHAGWPYRRHKAMLKKQRELQQSPPPSQGGPISKHTGGGGSDVVADPFAAQAASNDEQQGRDFDPAIETHIGIVLGIGTCSYRDADGVDHFVALPGDDLRVSFPKASLPPEAISEFYTIVDLYESKMSEYDSNFMFVPLRELQQSRGMIDPETGVGKFTSIQIKLRPGADAEQVRDALRNHFPAQFYLVSTWRDKQGPLLAAVQMETAVLNVLLFMIIAVAGFGILAIFTMIVVEKTRDIGILKSLGASGQGVMGIFLGYGLALGIVGAGVGMALGLLFVKYINQIADLLGRITGQPVFDPSVYYFYKIPTIVDPQTVMWISAGAVAIAVLASVLPARRAARLHPVRALRYE